MLKKEEDKIKFRFNKEWNSGKIKDLLKLYCYFF